MQVDLINGIMETFSPLSLTILLAIPLLALAYFTIRYKDVPPGPIGLPYFGYLPFMSNADCHLKLDALKKKYGDIFSFTCTGRLYIHLGSFKAFREALVSKSECFTDRMSGYNLGNQLSNGGISYLTGKTFFSIRKFSFASHERTRLKLQKSLKAWTARKFEDKSKLCYFNAYVLETMRNADFFNVFPTLECTKETTLRGYKIPKGAILAMNFYSTHYDPEVFEEPKKFNPSRYIQTERKKRPELPVTFGVGKRACLGEGYVMMQVFLLLATLVQNFHLRLPEGKKKITVEDFLTGKLLICAIPREKS
ncbi:Cytochrome P450 1A2 like protein [Argiope bruennichi]|uniref:Cytochrome P450 1A2 like protein n=1 Tax=Argiope bruennichi TaxID=94029 RepID=A0A8T0E2T6_ARGBR|nr:Cytochrome P450 1A2 like protein [Argiope bruennichi]